MSWSLCLCVLMLSVCLVVQLVQWVGGFPRNGSVFFVGQFFDSPSRGPVCLTGVVDIVSGASSDNLIVLWLLHQPTGTVPLALYLYLCVRNWFVRPVAQLKCSAMFPGPHIGHPCPVNEHSPGVGILVTFCPVYSLINYDHCQYKEIGLMSHWFSNWGRTCVSKISKIQRHSWVDCKHL